MTISVRDSANMLGRTILAEQIACLITIAHRQNKLDNKELRSKIGKLRTLVGAVNTEKYLELSKEIWNELNDVSVSPYLREKYRSSQRSIRKILKRKDFDEQWIESNLFIAEQAQWISDEELWGWFNQFENDEALSRVLLEGIHKRGIAKTLEDLGNGIDEKELLRKVEVVDLTMGELRLLQLVLELYGEIKVVPRQIPENPPFELPKENSI